MAQQPQQNRELAPAPGGAPPAVPAVVKQFRDDLKRMEPEFTRALPPHIPVARFMRVVQTAVQNNSKLLGCTRQSLFNACVQAAYDGLYPDGREGAIVPYGEDEDGKGKSEIARWMPMVLGLRKKARNSGMLSDWNVQVVQEGDEWSYQLGDRPFIHHVPAMRGGRTRDVIAAYSVATYKDGMISREVMNIDQIRDIQRFCSKAKKGPWNTKEFFPEMCRKTVARLHAKQLPMSTDLDTLMRRDDDLYDFKKEREEAQKTVQRPGSAAAALAFFGGAEEPQGEVIDATAAAADQQNAVETQKPASDQPKPAEAPQPDQPKAADQKGADAPKGRT
jgi:recombination protein RecT